MDENKVTYEEEVTIIAEEADADAIEELMEETAVEEIAEEAEAVAEEIAEEAEAAAERIAKEVKSEEEIPDETEAGEETAEDVKTAADNIVAKIKALVKDGSVTYVRIRKDDTVVLNLPMTVGIIGGVLGLAAAPWVVIIAAITTVGLKCTVEVEKKDGTIITIHGSEKKDE